MSIKINMLYWNNGDPQRLANTNFSWYFLKKFCQYVGDHLLVEPRLFDFSAQQVLAEAIHIPYPTGEYKRAAKINQVIDYYKHSHVTFFAVMDSDLIIPERDYYDMVCLLNLLQRDSFYVCYLDDLTGFEGIDFNHQKIYYDDLKVEQRIMEPDLGGLFFVDYHELAELGGFDERFTVWGGEDNEMANRLLRRNLKKLLLPIKPLHLPHRHALTQTEVEQYHKQVQILRDQYAGIF
jgi:hypothetical protein